MILTVGMIKAMLPNQVRALNNTDYTELRNFVIKFIKEEDSRRK